MTDELNFFVLERFANPLEAHVGRALLESEGIPAILATEHHVWAHWNLSLALGGVRLLVPSQHVDAARQLLHQRDSGDLEAALEDMFPSVQWVCQRCGGSQVKEHRDGVWKGIAMLLLFLTGTFFPPAKEQRCAACGAGLR